MEKSPVYARYGHKRALSDCQRALSDCKGALSDCKRALSNCKRALGDCKRALSNCNRALSECKRALYSRDVKELQTCCIVYHQRIMPAHIWHTKRGRVLQYVAVHIHICIYTYTYICMYTNIYVCRHTFTQYEYICIYPDLCQYTSSIPKEAEIPRKKTLCMPCNICGRKRALQDRAKIRAKEPCTATKEL